MDEETHAPEESGPTAQTAPRIEVAEPVSSHIEQPATEQQLEQVEREMNSFERSTLRWTKATFVVFAGTMVFVALQWIAMRAQLGEMRSGSKDTHDLAVAARKQADRTKDLADRMKDQADQTKVIADQAVIQAGTSKRAAQTAVDTLGSTQKTFRAEQRAWVGINTLTVVQFAKDKTLRVDIGFFNSGRTPALKVSDGSKFIFSNTFVVGPDSTWPMNFLMEPQQSVPPQGAFSRQIEMPQQLIGPRYEDIKAGNQILYFYGRLLYTATSETVNGLTQFCVFLRMVDDKPNLAFCPNFNDLK